MASLPPLVHRKVSRLFLALIGAQLLHSMEEYFTELYLVFRPARVVSGLFTSDLGLGFASTNAVLVGFGVWCLAFRVRPNPPSVQAWIWPWVILELTNGVGHLGLAAIRGSYFPGAATAPVLVAVSATLAYHLTRGHAPARVTD